jgi:protein associated with RNAse G/E
MRNPVTVRKLKFDGSVKYEWDGDLVEAIGDDWAIVFHDSELHDKREALLRPAEPRSYGFHYVGLTQPLTVLVSFDERGDWTGAKCDAALPGAVRGRAIDFVDLDLDVIVGRDLSYYVRDVEVFAERSRTMAYGDEAKSAALRGIGLAIALVERREPPFDGSAEALLGRVLAAAGPI